MLNTKINFIICSIILAFGASIFVSGYMDYKFHPPLLENIPVNANNSGLDKEVFNREMVVEKNIFNLQTGREFASSTSNTSQTGSLNSGSQSAGQNAGESPTKTAEEFEGELLGVLAGDEVYLAMIKLKNDILILRKNVPKNGLELLEVFPDSVNVKYKGDIYSLTFPEENIPGINGAVAESESDQKNSNKDGLHYTISKQYLRNQMQDMNSLLRTVFISPHYEDGNFIGYRISRLANSSPLTKVGIKKGDILVQINGQTLDSPNKMLELFSKIDDLTAATIDILRDGEKKTLFVEVES